MSEEEREPSVIGPTLNGPSEGREGREYVREELVSEEERDVRR